MSVQVSLIAEERDRNISRVQELEASITELKNAAGASYSSSLIYLIIAGFFFFFFCAHLAVSSQSRCLCVYR